MRKLDRVLELILPSWAESELQLKLCPLSRGVLVGDAFQAYGPSQREILGSSCSLGINTGTSHQHLELNLFRFFRSSSSSSTSSSSSSSSVKCRISEWTNRRAHVGTETRASCVPVRSGPVATLPEVGLLTCGESSLMSLGISLRIYTRTIPKRDSKAPWAQPFHGSPRPSLPEPLAFFCLGARTFLEDRSKSLSDALLSEVAHFLPTFFSAVMV